MSFPCILRVQYYTVWVCDLERGFCCTIVFGQYYPGNMFCCPDCEVMICSSFGSMQDLCLCYWSDFDNGKGHRFRIRLNQSSGFELELCMYWLWNVQRSLAVI